MTDTRLTIEKLQSMLGAHADGVYRFSARGEGFTEELCEQLLATMQENERLRENVEEYAMRIYDMERDASEAVTTLDRPNEVSDV